MACARPLSVSNAGAISSVRRISSAMRLRPSVRAAICTSPISSVAMGLLILANKANLWTPGTTSRKELEALAGKIGGQNRQAGDVAAGSRKAGDEAGADGISHHRGHDRNDRRSLLGRDDRRGCIGDNDIDLEPDELRRDLRHVLAAAFRPAILDRDGAAFDPPELAQPLHESGNPSVHGQRRAGTQKPDGWQSSSLLCASG